jgi:hypothetical protein
MMVPKKGAFRINKIVAFVKFSVLGFLVLSPTGFGVSGATRQTIPDILISIELRNVLLRDALNKIGDVAHVSFVYANNKALDKNKVSINVHRQKIGAVLDQLLRPYSLSYTVVDNRVIVWNAAGKSIRPAL